MPTRIKDYALIGDTQTAALVGRNGSIDWLCLPRFDSAACFAALLGTPEHGRWLLSPEPDSIRHTRRRYRQETLILETEFTTESGTVKVIDCMPPRETTPDVVRVVQGLQGTVNMCTELAPRFDYGSVAPWVQAHADDRVLTVAGPDALALSAPIHLTTKHQALHGRFTVHAGECFPFVLTWYPSFESPPPAVDGIRSIANTEAWWHEWGRQCRYAGPWRDVVVSSLITLKALTYAPTGGIVAAATTSLPEWPRGVRNWDYRYCWLRDATFTLYALLLGGHESEAAAFRDWLLRTVAGDPAKLQIMYGVAGERRLPEHSLPWLPGHADSVPVRVGNAAADQCQLDVYGEVLDALYQARRVGLAPDPESWKLQVALLDFLEGNWKRADQGLWEMRGAAQQFTHSKLMTWVAFDRAVKTCRKFGRPGPVSRWRALRDALKAQICACAWSSEKQAFTQAYGSERLDASALLIPQVGFLPPNDPRVLATVRAVERELLRDGFVWRYATEHADDGLPPCEGAFLACSFWLADYYAMSRRWSEALQFYERLLSIRNDVGLLSEQYLPSTGELLGNFPQAFSHVGLVNTAFNLTWMPKNGPAHMKGW